MTALQTCPMMTKTTCQDNTKALVFVTFMQRAGHLCENIHKHPHCCRSLHMQIHFFVQVSHGRSRPTWKFAHHSSKNTIHPLLSHASLSYCCWVQQAVRVSMALPLSLTELPGETFCNSWKNKKAISDRKVYSTQLKDIFRLSEWLSKETTWKK